MKNIFAVPAKEVCTHHVRVQQQDWCHGLGVIPVITHFSYWSLIKDLFIPGKNVMGQAT